MPSRSRILPSQRKSEDAPAPSSEVENLLATLLANHDPRESVAGSSVDEIVSIVRELNVWNFKNEDLRWDVEPSQVAHLSNLPRKVSHSGDFEWEGPASEAMPKWLWDSKKQSTIQASEEHFKDGYIAVSYTWGRYQKSSAYVSGTLWSVPVLDTSVFADMWLHLKSILCAIPGCRYFWVDVWCIDQDNEIEKQKEIAKQASIFGNAKCVLVYLWTLDLPGDLAHIIANFGDLLLWSLTFSQMPNQQLSKFNNDRRFLPQDQRLLDGTLILEPWFSSLWALQEMIVSPASVWMTRKGDIVNVNGSVITTRQFALAIKLLSWACRYREVLWHRAWAPRRLIRGFNLGSSTELVNSNATYVSAESLRGELSAKGVVEVHIHTDRSRNHFEAAKDAPAWVAERWHEEWWLYQRAQTWRDWAHSETNISLCCGTSRTEILVASSYRASTRRRAEAIMAALKISYRPELISPAASEGLGPGGLPVSLLNLLFDLEGRSFLYCSHAGRRQIAYTRNRQHPYKSKNIDPALGVLPDDTIPWLDQLIDDGTPYTIHLGEKFEDQRIHGRLESSILPPRATFRNAFNLDLDQYKAISGCGCHVHSDCSIHIPFGTIMHQVPNVVVPASVSSWEEVAMNGALAIREGSLDVAYLLRSDDETNIFMPLELMTAFIQRQDYAKSRVGEECHVKLFPLLVRTGDIPPLDRHHLIPSSPPPPKVIGLILMARKDFQFNDPLTCWVRYGLYGATTFKEEILDWRDGILAAVYVGEEQCRKPTACQYYGKTSKLFADVRESIVAVEKSEQELMSLYEFYALKRDRYGPSSIETLRSLKSMGAFYFSESHLDSKKGWILYVEALDGYQRLGTQYYADIDLLEIKRTLAGVSEKRSNWDQALRFNESIFYSVILHAPGPLDSLTVSALTRSVEAISRLLQTCSKNARNEFLRKLDEELVPEKISDMPEAEQKTIIKLRDSLKQQTKGRASRMLSWLASR